MSAISLNGIPVVRGRMVIPFSGIWHADLILNLAQDITGPQTLLLDGNPWICSVVRALDFAGVRSLLVVGGSGGWRKPIPAKQYTSTIPIQSVLVDAALAAGELTPAGAIGTVPDYVRPSGPAGTVLQQLIGDGWWMNPAGVVQCTPRPSIPVTSSFQAMALDGAPGIYTIATEFPNDWQPGVTFLGPTISGTASRVMHTIEPRTFRTEVMSNV